MRHVLLFTDTPICGGAEQQMYLLAKFLNKEKYRVSLACLANSSLNPICQKFIEEGFSVFRLPVSHKNDPRAFFMLRDIIKRELIDLIHIHLWNPASSRFALMAVRMQKKPYVITEHDPFLLSAVKQFIKKQLIGRTHGIIALSSRNKKFLYETLKSAHGKFHQVSNGIDCDYWLSEMSKISKDDRDMFRQKEFGAKKENPVFINVATLHERKGQRILMQAFTIFLKNAPGERAGSKLVFVGEGPAKNEYENIVSDLGIKNSVLFLGQRKDIPMLLSAGDVYVHPSIREAFGLAILEAGIANLPVIASDVGGIPDIIENEMHGLLVPPGKPWELSDAMIRILDDKLRQRIAKNLQQRVIEKFDAKTMAYETQLVYDVALQS